MKRLILMRHAKSDWARGTDDHDRPLNPRGRRGATALGDWLRAQVIAPDEVLCSSAMRTRETLLRLTLGDAPVVSVTRDLYLATPADILTCLQGARGDVVLVIGHNPGIANCARQVLKSPPDHVQFAVYPTGATLVADCDIDSWEEMRWGCATCRHFVVPRELTGED